MKRKTPTAKTAQTAKTRSRSAAKGRQQSVSGAPSTSGSEQIETAIGREVRALRVRKQIPSHVFAERAGISLALLSRLEHGKVSPSLSTLNSIAQALGVPFTALFQQVSARNTASLVKAGAGQQVDRAGTPAGQRYTSLGMPLEGKMQLEPYLITIDKDTVPYSTFQHDGIEMIHMLEGALTYRHGSKSYQMKAGDTLFFDARYSHGPQSFEKIPARFLSVICYERG